MIAVCNRCGHLCTLSGVDGYTYECRHCDEDFTVEVRYFDDDKCVELYNQFFDLCSSQMWSESNRKNRFTNFSAYHKVHYRTMQVILNRGNLLVHPTFYNYKGDENAD